jgi:hypothetical protein
MSGTPERNGLGLLTCQLVSGRREFKGERLTVQFARGPRRKEAFPGPSERNALPRPPAEK